VITTGGAFLNASGIFIGALFGLALRQPLSVRAQFLFRNLLGAASIFFGLRLVWLSVSGTFSSGVKQIVLALLAVSLGFWLGKWLRLQEISNWLGRRAKDWMTNPPRKAGAGFGACAILFCAAPLGLIGAVTDGLTGYFWLLAVKAVMDGLGMMAFVKMFRWPAALSAFPVFVVLGGISLGCQDWAKPFLDARHLADSVNAVAGFTACAVALVILEIRKVELANFLPALAVAPLLAWWLQ
jgi:uncharacterized protein